VQFTCPPFRGVEASEFYTRNIQFEVTPYEMTGCFRIILIPDSIALHQERWHTFLVHPLHTDHDLRAMMTHKFGLTTWPLRSSVRSPVGKFVVKCICYTWG